MTGRAEVSRSGVSLCLVRPPDSPAKACGHANCQLSLDWVLTLSNLQANFHDLLFGFDLLDPVWAEARLYIVVSAPVIAVKA